MKTKFVITLETPDQPPVLIDEGDTESMYKQKDGQIKKELIDFRKDYGKDLHEAITKRIQIFFNDKFESGGLEEQFFDGEEELSVEGWDTFDDYGITIKMKVTKVK
jgi:hypothetical protein